MAASTLAAGETLQAIAPAQNLILNAGGDIVGVRNTNSTGADFRGASSTLGKRIASSNRNVPPIYYQTETTNTCIIQGVIRKFSANAAWSQVQPTYAGYYYAGAVESPTTAVFTLEAAFEYPVDSGTLYPVTFGGASVATIPVGQTVKQADVITGLVVPEGGIVREWTKRVFAANSSVLVTHQNDAAFGEVSQRGTNNAQTIAAVAATRGAAGYFTIVGGTITALVTTAGGQGYTAQSFCGVYAFDPDAGAVTSTLIAAPSQTGGVVAVGTLTTGLVNTTGWGPNTYPVYVMSGLDTTQRAYCASVVTAIPAAAAGVDSLLIVGDSNGKGYGSSDTLGDGARNYGVYERAIGARCGVMNMSFPGATAINFLADTSLFPLTLSMYQPYATRVFMQAGGNDLAGATSAGPVITSMNSLAVIWKARGASVSFGTPFVRTTGTYASDGTQTPASGFAAGGPIDDLTFAVRNQLHGLISEFGIFEARGATESKTTPNVWASTAQGKVSEATAETGAQTTDGTHASTLRGLRVIARLVGIPGGL